MELTKGLENGKELDQSEALDLVLAIDHWRKACCCSVIDCELGDPMNISDPQNQ